MMLDEGEQLMLDSKPGWQELCNGTQPSRIGRKHMSLDLKNQ